MRRPESSLAEALSDLERALVVALDRLRHAGHYIGARPREERRVFLVPDDQAARGHISDGPTSAEPDPREQHIFDALREWRAEVAGGKPRYTVCRDDLLAAVAREKPRTLSALAGLAEVGRAFVTRHGESLLTALDNVAPPP